MQSCLGIGTAPKASRGFRSFVIGALALFGVAAPGSGCAYVTAQPVKPGDRINGIRIYDVKPLLVVTGETVSLQMVPNYNRAYALRFGAFLAKNHFQATMSNGVLTGVNALLDSTAIVEVLKVLAEKIPVGFAGEGGTPAAKGGIKDRFQVYEIVFDDDGNLVGLKPLLIEQNLLRVKTGSSGQGFSGGGAVVVPQPGGAVAAPQPGVTPGPVQ